MTGSFGFPPPPLEARALSRENGACSARRGLERPRRGKWGARRSEPVGFPKGDHQGMVSWVIPFLLVW